VLVKNVFPVEEGCSLGIDGGIAMGQSRSMKCPYCGSKHLVKNGRSRHGNQRWLCKECHKTVGDFDRRKIGDEIRKVALERYLAGKGLRATERVVGVSHNSVMQWVFDSAKEELVSQVLPDSLEWVSQKDLESHVGETVGSSGVILVLPSKFAEGQWAVLKPQNPSAWMRRFIKVLLGSEIKNSVED
jgi:transposase-like protein